MSCDIVNDWPLESDATRVTRYVLGEGNECVTDSPVSFEPSPKFHENEKGGVPPVGVAIKFVVCGVMPVTVKLAQNAGGVQPIGWKE